MNKRSKTIPDFYEAYNAEFPDTIEYNKYKDILVDLFQMMSEGLLYKSTKYTLPFGIGTLSVNKFKVTGDKKALRVDYASTRKFGKIIYHLNEHSNGYNYKLYWAKGPVRNRKSYAYSASLTRANKRLLAKLIKNRITDYPEF